MASGQPDHTKVTLMKGTDPSGNLVTVAVDTNGNIVGVFKGAYEGSLKTLATDEKGRLLARVTDPEDIWGQSHLIGNAELAARLGALSTYERRGNVRWFNDFSTGLGCWNPLEEGTGADVSLSTQFWSQGGYSAKITTPTDSNYDAYILHFENPISYQTNFGFECSFSSYPEVPEICFILRVCTSTDYTYYIIFYRPGDQTLEYFNAYAGRTTFATDVDFFSHRNIFLPVKLVVDQTNNKYLRFYLRNQEYDLSDCSPYVDDTPPYPPRLELEVDLVGDADNNYTGYVDYALFTVNEPAT